MYKSYYKEFLDGHKDLIHLASHSHHFWPDITKEAVIQAWNDSANFSDHKWGHIFSTQIPMAQNLIGEILNFKRVKDIAFAPNTHELIARVLSCFQAQDEVNILTTTSEFHSLNRQVDRLSELENYNVLKVENEESNFKSNFLDSINNKTSIIFLSQVFFNTGEALPLSFIKEIIAKKSKETILCIDGYHAFCAIPTDISTIADDIFYLAGGYKYAQAGEGCCFMTLPKDCNLRPVNTGWFASFDTLEEKKSLGKVHYSDSGFRFWGSTQDLTSIYRFNSVWSMFLNKGISIKKIHEYIQSLQNYFLKNIDRNDLFMNTDLTKQGHFLTIDFKDSSLAQTIYIELKNLGILTDYRGSRLRFGFGLYLDRDDIETSSNQIKSVLRKIK